MKTTLEKLNIELDKIFDSYFIVEFDEVWDRAKIISGKKLYDIKFGLQFTSLFTPTKLKITKYNFVKRVG